MEARLCSNYSCNESIWNGNLIFEMLSAMESLKVFCHGHKNLVEQVEMGSKLVQQSFIAKVTFLQCMDTKQFTMQGTYSEWILIFMALCSGSPGWSM